MASLVPSVPPTPQSGSGLKRPPPPPDDEERLAKRVLREKCVCLYIIYRDDGFSMFCKSPAAAEYKGIKYCARHMMQALLNDTESGVTAIIQIPQ